MKGWDRAVAALVLAVSILSPWHGLLYDVVALLGLGYLTWRISPTRMLGGKPVVLDDAIVVLGFLLLVQPFTSERTLALATGGIVLTAYSFVVAFTLMSGPRWRGIARAFGLAWFIFAVVFRPAAIVVIIAPWMTAVAAITLIWRPHWKLPVDMFHSRNGMLLGVAGLLVAHATLFTILAMRDILPFWSLGWVLSAVGTLAIVAMPPYMWYVTYKVRDSHEHLPDWPAWLVSLVSAITLLAVLSPVVKMVPGIPAVVLRPLGTPISPLYLSMAAGVLVLWLIIGSLDHFLRKLLMVGPFLVGAIFLGLYTYNAFVSEFGMLMSVTDLVPIFVHVLVFVTMALFLMLGYFSFLYELWRD